MLGTQKAALESIFTGSNIKYRVNFPVQQPIPKLTQILYNGRRICTGPKDSSGFVTTVKLEHTLKTDVSNANQANKPFVSNNQVVQTTPSTLSGIEIVVHPDGDVSARPILETNKEPEISDVYVIVSGTNDNYPYSTTPKPFVTTTTTERNTQKPITTTKRWGTSTPLLPSTLGSLDDLLEELYGSNVPYTRPTTTKK